MVQYRWSGFSELNSSKIMKNIFLYKAICVEQDDLQKHGPKFGEDSFHTLVAAHQFICLLIYLNENKTFY